MFKKNLVVKLQSECDLISDPYSVMLQCKLYSKYGRVLARG